MGWGGFRCITEFKPKPYLALAGIWLGWGCDNNKANLHFFLTHQIVISKLREKIAMDHDKKHWKAAKVRDYAFVSFYQAISKNVYDSKSCIFTDILPNFCTIFCLYIFH